MSQITHPQVNFRAAGSTSDKVSLEGQTLCGFYIPAGFVGTSISFNVCDTYNGTFVPLKDNTGVAISYTVSGSGSGQYCKVNPADFAGVRHYQIVSNGTEAANTVVKTAIREIA